MGFGLACWEEGRERERSRGRQGKEEMSEMSMRAGIGTGAVLRLTYHEGFIVL